MLDARMLDCFINMGSEKTATKSILVLNVRSGLVEGSNSIAKEYFLKRGDEVVYEDLFEYIDEGRNIMRLAMGSLESREEITMTNREIITKDKVRVKADLKFMYITPEKNYLLIVIKPEIDNKRYYLERFVDTRRRPAFTYNINDLTIDYANNLFHRAFATDKVRLVKVHNSKLTNFMSEDYRADFNNTIRDSVNSISSMIIDIPFSTATGKHLSLFYNTETLKGVSERNSGIVYFCMVERGENLKDVSDPFE